MDYTGYLDPSFDEKHAEVDDMRRAMLMKIVLR